jgi:hypothetical protein
MGLEQVKVLVGRPQALVGIMEVLRVSLDRRVVEHWAPADCKTHAGDGARLGDKSQGGRRKFDGCGAHGVRRAHRGRRGQSSYRRSSTASVVPARAEAQAAHNAAVECNVNTLERCGVVARRHIDIHARRRIENGARRRSVNRIAA